MDVVGESARARLQADDVSSSSLSDLSPRRSSELAMVRDAAHHGVAPKNSNYPAPPAISPSPLAAQGQAHGEKAEKPKKNNRGPITLPDGTVRERKKPGPKPKPKDPNAPEKPKRKRQKVAADAPTSAPSQSAEVQNALPSSQPAPLRQSKINDLVNHAPPSHNRTGGDAPHANSTPTNPHLATAASSIRPASSGQMFDPIRGAMSTRVSQSPSHSHNRPGPLAPSATASVTSAPVSPTPPMVKPMQPDPLPQHTAAVSMQRVGSAKSKSNHTHADAMDIDDGKKQVAKTEPKSGGLSSNAPTPPPAAKPRAKELPPPLPAGSGLLSGTPFGGIGEKISTNGVTGTNIYLTFALKGQNNVTINFAREVEKEYGFAALHPRLAARKERQRQIAAAGTALEKAQGLGSPDEMSLDLSEPDSANEADENADAGSNAQPGDAPKKRRKRKAEDYDRGDEFIDDTEMAWEESALMAKDGFFVYSGPLINESDKALQIERVDGAPKRGRGRGRGGAARGDGATRARGASTRGARGGTTVRKPRVTKADRAAMELEKLEREKLAAQIGVVGSTPASAAASAIGNGIGTGLGVGIAANGTVNANGTGTGTGNANGTVQIQGSAVQAQPFTGTVGI